MKLMKRTTIWLSLFLCFFLLNGSVRPASAAGGVDGPPVYTAEEQFTEEDLRQEADLSQATVLTVTDGAQLEISAPGVYVLSGSAKKASVTVKAGKKDVVQLVLDGLHIVSQSGPCVNVQKAAKVYITTTESENSLEISGQSADGAAAIYSKDDLTLSGKGTLVLRSSKDGVTVKGTLRITGGTYELSCQDAGFDAKDSIRMAGGDITINECQDGLHAENNKDDTLGYVYIAGGSLRIACLDDAIHGNAAVQIDGGEITLTGHEGIESTRIRLNGGSVVITASDDGLNAGRKSTAWEPAVEISGGYLSVTTTTSKCDAIDANGDILIHGGDLNIHSNRPFDCDGVLEWTGGTVTVNGREIAPGQIDSLIVR